MKKIDNATNRMVTKIVRVVASLSSLAILNSMDQYTQHVPVVNRNGTWQVSERSVGQRQPQ